MGEAFEKAKSSSDPAQRLKEIATAALKASPRNWDGAKDILFKTVRTDAVLLWALFEPFRAQAAQRLLSEAGAELRIAELREAQARKPLTIGTGGRSPAETHSLVAPRPADPKVAMQAVAAVAQQSLLDTFKVRGRPIGDCTPREANAWALTRETDAKFVRLLTQNLPPDQPIRKFRSADDTSTIHAQAVKEVRSE